MTSQDSRIEALEALIRAGLAIHRPCHGPGTEPWGCEWGHYDVKLVTGIPGPDVPAVCVSCGLGYPCQTAAALGATTTTPKDKS